MKYPINAEYYSKRYNNLFYRLNRETNQLELIGCEGNYIPSCVPPEDTETHIAKCLSKINHES